MPRGWSRRERANVLVVVLGLAVLVASEIYVVSAYSAGNLSQTGRSTARLHAVYVGESAFGRILARLRSARWHERWFREAPEDAEDIPLCGGRCSWSVADAPGADRRVDVWIRAGFDGARVTMFWRVHHRDVRLDLHGSVIPEFFTFLPDGSARPTPRADDPVRAEIALQMADAAARLPDALRMAREATSHRDFPGLARVLGLVPPGPVPDDLVALGGGPAVRQAEYLERVELEPAAPAPDLAPAAPAGSALSRDHPTPIDFPAVIAMAFAAAGLPPAAAPTVAHFADPARALAEWRAAVATPVSGTREPGWLTRWNHTRRYLEELDRTVVTPGCAPCDDVLTTLISYLEEVTRLESARTGKPLPRPQDVDPLSFGGNARSRVLAEYGRWWNE